VPARYAVLRMGISGMAVMLRGANGSDTTVMDRYNMLKVQLVLHLSQLSQLSCQFSQPRPQIFQRNLLSHFKTTTLQLDLSARFPRFS
jgi:hypothetical protein